MWKEIERLSNYFMKPSLSKVFKSQSFPFPSHQLEAAQRFAHFHSGLLLARERDCSKSGSFIKSLLFTLFVFFCDNAPWKIRVKTESLEIKWEFPLRVESSRNIFSVRRLSCSPKSMYFNWWFQNIYICQISTVSSQYENINDFF